MHFLCRRRFLTKNNWFDHVYSHWLPTRLCRTIVWQGVHYMKVCSRHNWFSGIQIESLPWIIQLMDTILLKNTSEQYYFPCSKKNNCWTKLLYQNTFAQHYSSCMKCTYSTLTTGPIVYKSWMLSRGQTTVCTICVCSLNPNLKGTVARDVLPLVFSWIDPIWAPDSHPKIFLNSVSNSRRYLYSKVKIRESSLSDTALIPNQCCQIQR
jgi:hypothetical protein